MNSSSASNVAVFGKLFGDSNFELVHEGDNTTEGSMLLNKSTTKDQQVISDALRRSPGFAACEYRLWWEHSAGLATGAADEEGQSDNFWGGRTKLLRHNKNQAEKLKCANEELFSNLFPQLYPARFGIRTDKKTDTVFPWLYYLDITYYIGCC